MKTGLNTWLTQAQFRRALDNGGFEIRPILGDELGKKAFREALVQYCGFAYGVSLCEELFSTKNLKI